MKVISKDNALAAVGMIADEIRPLRGESLTNIGSAVAKRYNFTRQPSLQETVTSGAKFHDGHFNDIRISELTVHSNGIAVTTRDTSDSERVFADLFEFLKTEFGFRDPTTKPARFFQSVLIVDLDNDPTTAISSISPVFELLQSELEELGGIRRQFHLARLSLGNDPLNNRYMDFTIERREGIAWSAKRFYCKAYVRTETHIKALTLLDSLLAARH